jgi:hypothetical protein
MELKPRILSVVTVIGMLTLMILFAMKHDSDSKVQEYSPDTESNRGVMAWLVDFTNRNYNACDSMLESDSDKLYSSQVVMMMNDQSYYTAALDGLVNCISAIQVKSIQRDTDTGIVSYTVSVVYTPYEQVGDLVYDTGALDEAKKNYENGKISDAEFQSELSRVYFEIFNENCFIEGDSTRQQDLVLSEKEINGVTYVYNTVSFVDSLLSDSNLKFNLSCYEKDVKSKVENIIKAD